MKLSTLRLLVLVAATLATTTAWAGGHGGHHGGSSHSHSSGSGLGAAINRTVTNHVAPQMQVKSNNSGSILQKLNTQGTNRPNLPIVNTAQHGNVKTHNTNIGGVVGNVLKQTSGHHGSTPNVGNAVKSLIGTPGSHASHGKVAGGVGIQKISGHSHNHNHKSHCGQVIDILVRHCNGNRSYDPCVRSYCNNTAIVGWLPEPVVVVGQEAAGCDLELVGVNVVSEGDATNGPVYQVSYRNNGLLPIGHFRISLVAVLGEIAESSPNVSIDIPGIYSGDTNTVQIQLPPAALTMTGAGQVAMPYDTLVVALDSYDEVTETSELNNVATLKRTAIPTMVANPQVAPEVAPLAAAPAANVPMTMPMAAQVAAPMAAPVTANAPVNAVSAVTEAENALNALIAE